MYKLIITTNTSSETVEFNSKKEAQEFVQIYIKENKYQDYKLKLVEDNVKSH